MRNYNFKILTVISIISILVTSCGFNTKDKATEAKVNIICQDVSNIKEESKPIKKDIEDGTLLSLPENTVRNYGFIDNENLMILIQHSEDSESSFCLYNIYTDILKEIIKGKSFNFNYLSKNKKKILYSTNSHIKYEKNIAVTTTKYRKNYIYDIDKNVSRYIPELEGCTKAIFADYNGRYILDNSFKKFLDTETNEIKTYDDIFSGTWGYSVDRNCSHPFPNNKLYFKGDHIIYEGLDKEFDKELAHHNVGIYSLDTETMSIDKPTLSFPEVICTLDKGPTDIYYISQFDFINDGKSIIFAGTYEKHPGIFIYDIDTKEITKVVFSYNLSSYNLSNDKTKILYCINENPEDESMYLAHIDKNTIITKKCLYKEVQLNLSSWWSPDNTFFLVNEKEYSSSPEVDGCRFDKIRKFNISK